MDIKNKNIKIPVPKCYINYNDKNEEEDIKYHKKEIQQVRNMFPEFSDWNDAQIVAFGGDFNQEFLFLSSFQEIENNMRDAALAMSLYSIDSISKLDNAFWFEKKYNSMGFIGLFDLITKMK